MGKSQNKKRSKSHRKEMMSKPEYLYSGKLDPYVFRRTKKLNTIFAIINLRLTRKNSLVNVADLGGKVLYWRSAGTVGYRSGKKRKAAHVTGLLGSLIAKKAAFNGIKFAKVVLRGSGTRNKLSFIRSIGRAGIRIASIRDFSNTPYNGCRPPRCRKKK